MKTIKQIAQNIINQGQKLLKVSQEKCVDMYHVGALINDIMEYGETERLAIARIRAELGEELPTGDISVYWSKHLAQSFTVFNTWTLDTWTDYIKTAPIACPKSITIIIAALHKGELWSESNFYQLVKISATVSGTARDKMISLVRKGTKVWELDNDKLESLIGNEKKGAPKKEKKSEKSETETELAATIAKKDKEIDKLKARIAELEATVADWNRVYALTPSKKRTPNVPFIPGI